MVVNKSKAAFRTIAEVADKLGVGTHVLRFWETKFSQIKPLKMSGGRRYYRPDDVKLLECIRDLLHSDRYTIEGVQKLFREKGIKAFVGDKIQDDFFAASEALNEQRYVSDNEFPIGKEIVDNVINGLITMRKELEESLN